MNQNRIERIERERLSDFELEAAIDSIESGGWACEYDIGFNIKLVAALCELLKLRIAIADGSLRLIAEQEGEDE